MAAYPFQNIIYSMVISLLNSKKAVRIQQFTDGATVVLRKHYHTGLNKINVVFCQHVLSITTLTIISKFLVLNFLNYSLIPSVKVLGNSDILPHSILDTISTLRLYSKCKDYMWDELHI